MPVDLDLAACRAKDSRAAAKARSLSSPIRADQAHDFARVDGETKRIHRPQGLVGLNEVGNFEHGLDGDTLARNRVAEKLGLNLPK